MKFVFEMTRDDFKKYYLKQYQKYNYIYYILYTIGFIFISLDIIFDNFLIVFATYIIGMLLLFLLTIILSHLFVNIILKKNDNMLMYGTYNCELTATSIKEKVKNNEIEIAWKDIKKLKKNKNYISLIPKKNDYIMFFKKNLIEPKTYEKLIRYIERKIK